jgi:hypothetical protein
MGTPMAGEGLETPSIDGFIWPSCRSVRCRQGSNGSWSASVPKRHMVRSEMHFINNHLHAERRLPRAMVRQQLDAGCWKT